MRRTKVRNILDKPPRKVHEEIKWRVQDIFYAPANLF